MTRPVRYVQTALADESIQALADAMSGGAADAGLTDAQLRATPVPVRAAGMTQLGYQQMTSASLAGAQAMSVPTGATLAVVQNNGTQPVRYRADGTNPTATVGQVLKPDKELYYQGVLGALKVIRVADGAILDIAYYG